MSSPFQQKFSAKSPLKPVKPVDPDAPGTPGKAGYEPPVKREDLDAKGRKIQDELTIENNSLLESGMTQEKIDKMRIERLEKKRGKLK